jgi:hypothetical protein
VQRIDFAYLIEQHVGDNNVLANMDRKDRAAILAVFVSFIQELDLKRMIKRYEN